MYCLILLSGKAGKRAAQPIGQSILPQGEENVALARSQCNTIAAIYVKL